MLKLLKKYNLATENTVRINENNEKCVSKVKSELMALADEKF